MGIRAKRLKIDGERMKFQRETELNLSVSLNRDQDLNECHLNLEDNCLELSESRLKSLDSEERKNDYFNVF